VAAVRREEKPEKKRGRDTIIAALLGIIAIVAVFGLLLWWVPERDQVESQECFAESTASAAFRPAASQQAAQKPKLTIKEDQKLTLAFGRSREQRVRTVAFTVEGALPAGTTGLHTDNTAFNRDSDDAQIPASQVKTRARVVGDEVQVDVCFDRAAVSVDPGSYVGTVTIDDPTVATTSIGMTLTFSFPYWSRVFALSLVVAFAASVYVFGLRKSLFTADAVLLQRRTIGDYLAWAGSGNGLLTIVVGGAAAFTAYSAIYLQAEDWGKDPAQILSLIGAIASGFVAAGTAGRLAAGGAPTEGPPKDGTAQQEGAPPPGDADGSVVPPADGAPPAEELPPAGPDDGAAPSTEETAPVGAGPEAPGGEPEAADAGVDGEEAGGPLLDEEELAGHEEDGQLDETDEGQRKEVGEETSDPDRAAAMLTDAEKDPEANT
jgi:hypothetical protein